MWEKVYTFNAENQTLLLIVYRSWAFCKTFATIYYYDHFNASVCKVYMSRFSCNTPKMFIASGLQLRIFVQDNHKITVAIPTKRWMSVTQSYFWFYFTNRNFYVCIIKLHQTTFVNIVHQMCLYFCEWYKT